MFFFVSFQKATDRAAFVGVVSGALFVFLAVFVLVCAEAFTQRWTTLLGLVVWATHLTMGLTFIYSTKYIEPWDQVMLPCSLAHSTHSLPHSLMLGWDWLVKYMNISEGMRFTFLAMYLCIVCHSAILQFSCKQF